MGQPRQPKQGGIPPARAQLIARLAASLLQLDPTEQEAAIAKIVAAAGEPDADSLRQACAICLDALICRLREEDLSQESPLAEFFGLLDRFPLAAGEQPECAAGLPQGLFGDLQLLWLLAELRDWTAAERWAENLVSQLDPEEPRLWLLHRLAWAAILQHRQERSGFLALWLGLVCEIRRQGCPRCALYLCLRWIALLNWGRETSLKKALLQKLRRQVTRQSNLFSAQVLYLIFTLEDRLVSPAQKMECARRLLRHPPHLLNSRQLQNVNFHAGNYSTGRKNGFAEAIQYFKQSNYYLHKNWTRLREVNRFLRGRLDATQYREAMAALELDVLELGSQVSLQNDAFVETLSAEYGQIRDLLEQVEQLSLSDPLTGLRNRRYLDHNLAQMLRFAARHAVPVCLASLDIDHFKQINDVHGHPAGDQVLRELAQLLLSFFRKSDIVIRSGGDEFLVVLFGATHERALELLRSLRARVAGFHFGLQALRLTLSIGIYCDPAGAGGNLAAALAQADRAMYLAKTAGGDRVAPLPANFPLDT